MNRTLVAALILASITVLAQTPSTNLGYTDTPMLPGLPYHVHDPARPRPPLVTPAARVGDAPSDATVLFDGRDLSAWTATKQPWKVENGYFEVIPNSGDLRTKETFGDVQLHVEWASPAQVRGDFDGTVKDGTLRVQTANGESVVLRRVERESPTLGAKPPAGAVVLFGEPDLSAFAAGKLDPRGFLAVGARTKERFGSFQLHVEFRTPFMPDARGQWRGNSGVYLQGRYEVQVLDSFGLAAEPDGCAAIYAQRAPDRNLSFPPLAWQTYDLAFQAASFDASGAKTGPAVVTLRHNGVLVHDAVEVSGPTGRGEPEGPEPGPLLLQDHWNPVVYRNVWLLPR